MNILFYLDQFPAIGGIETVTATLANGFAERGDAVTIVSHRWRNNADKTVRLDARISVLHMPDRVGVTVSNRMFLKREIEARKIDVVVFQDSYCAIEENLLPTDTRAKIVTVEHNAPYFEPDIHVNRSSLRKLLWQVHHPFWRHRQAARACRRRRFLYAHSDRYVLLSTRFYGEFKAIARLTDIRKLRAIPNPFAAQLKADPSEKQNEIVFCGTLSDLKGCDMLLRVWQIIENRIPDWRLTLVGDGPKRDMLEALRDDLGLARCTFEGYQSDPSKYFSRAKIFAFPSRREGWGLVLVEAMVNGCVPVAFDSFGAVHDIVKDGVNGFVVPAFDTEFFGVKLCELAQDPALLSRFSECARQVANDFSRDNVMCLWCRVLQEVLHG